MPPSPANEDSPWDEFSSAGSSGGPSDSLPDEPPEDSPEIDAEDLEDDRPTRWPLLVAVITMRPLLSGRNWQTEDVTPENGCISIPGLSALSGWK